MTLWQPTGVVIKLVMLYYIKNNLYIILNCVILNHKMYDMSASISKGGLGYLDVMLRRDECQCVVTQNITVPSPSSPPLTPELSSHLDKLSYH